MMTLALIMPMRYRSQKLKKKTKRHQHGSKKKHKKKIKKWMIAMVFDGDKQEQWSVIQQVDFIIEKAIDHRASDIHFESTENGLRVRYRIDGVLYDQPPLS